MLAIPASYKEISPTADVLYLSLHVDTAVAMLGGSTLWSFADATSRSDLVAVGVDRANARRASQLLPSPWTGRVGDHVVLDLTPCTRSAFASVTGQPGAARVARQDLVALCVSHERLWASGARVVYADRLCTRPEARFSEDRELLGQAAWSRIRARDFRSDPADPEAVHHYDASALAQGPLPTSLVGAIACKDAATADKVRTRLPRTGPEAYVLPNLLW